MRGTVTLFNSEDGVAAVETEHGEFTVLGIMDDDAVAVGDIITGDLESLDYQVMNNETRGVSLSVYVEDTELPLEEAEQKLQ
ncbi:hypothetical protein [Aquisalimonas asiatica]|uniref:DUF5666 domain-containing protein n=1 Tax=Aquisalimonas asiatica TaxID=406100 RepID=A0A1H8RLM8_9GAMM|nr:hypothetical protein [Aquisalimonas asiatica]SEO67459.1 hypothetical protein SAMN04488052_102116 [Aquisalimonas asiatica]